MDAAERYEDTSMGRAQSTLVLAALVLAGAIGSVSLRAAQDAPPPVVQPPGLPAGYTGRDIFQLACETCHGHDGRGSPRSIVGFDVPLPDFTDCAFTTPEPVGDWTAVIHEGGPIRGLDRRMPAFGDALSMSDIEKVINYVWTFCGNRAWPRGDLNVPRAFFTEKAFPENEAIWTTAISTGRERAVGNDLQYERRLGIRNQVELDVPIDFQQSASSRWAGGVGDVTVAMKRVLHSSLEAGRIVSAGAEIALPTGNRDEGRGNGVAVYEPSLMWSQLVGRTGFVGMHTGFGVPFDHRNARNEAFWRTALGTTVAQDRGFGRAWTPMVELLWAREDRAESEWDAVPQLQVSLSKLQHIMVSVGVRIPITQREERKPQVLTYGLWDWFDGGFLEFWR